MTGREFGIEGRVIGNDAKTRHRHKIAQALQGAGCEIRRKPCPHPSGERQLARPNCLAGQKGVIDGTQPQAHH